MAVLVDKNDFRQLCLQCGNDKKELNQIFGRMIIVAYLWLNQEKQRNQIAELQRAREEAERKCRHTQESLRRLLRKELNSLDEENVLRFAACLGSLTHTERRVYDMYLADMTVPQILSELGVRETTLKYHNGNIYSKLGVRNRHELKVYAEKLAEVRKEKNVETI